MKLKTYTGATMAEALRKVKRQLGRDAVIVSTRTVTRGGFLGLGGRRHVEITAAGRLADLPHPLRAGTLRVRPRDVARADGAAPTMPTAPPPAPPGIESNVLTEVGTLKSLVQDLMRETRRTRAPDVPDELLDTYLALIRNEVAQDLAASLIDRVKSDLSPDDRRDPCLVRRCLARHVESLVPVAGAIRLQDSAGPTTIALVGPTGVGKTTTLAKLAANLRLRDGRSVGLITIDTYRIGAVDQLRTYARIIDVPIEVVMTPGQLVDAVERMRECDVVLIDTAGRGQRDATKLGELKAFFEMMRPHEVHLVLSSGSREAVLHDTIDRFAGVGIDRVIFTKLDEAIGFGVVLSCLQKSEAALSYLTTGQDVPDDIEIGARDRIARLIVDGGAESVGSAPSDARLAGAV